MDTVTGTPQLEMMALYCESPKQLLFVENETNLERFYGVPNLTRFPKDGINDYLIHSRQTVHLEQKGTKAAAHCQFTLKKTMLSNTAAKPSTT